MAQVSQPVGMDIEFDERYFLLSRVEDCHVFTKPFRYLHIPNALDEDVYTQLETTFPIHFFRRLKQFEDANKRLDVKPCSVEEELGLSSGWRKFIRANSGPEFLQKVSEVFKFDQDLGDLRLFSQSNFRKARKVYGSVKEISEVHIGPYFSLNTPTSSVGDSVRGVHLDAENKLASSLFYLRDKNDQSAGRDFVINAWRCFIPSFLKGWLYREIKATSSVFYRKEKIIRYAANSYLLFCNDIDALHSVTVPMSQSPERRIVNINIEADIRLFKKSRN